MSAIIKNEQDVIYRGITGRAQNVVVWPAGNERWSGLIANQKISFRREFMDEYDGKRRIIRVSLRFDDECKKGHETFSITGEILNPVYHGDRAIECCGCIHEEIEKHFPELAPLIKWHLVSVDAPMHYIANTVYLASDRDHWGRAKGEPCAWDEFIQFPGAPIIKVKDSLAKFLTERREFFKQVGQANWNIRPDTRGKRCFEVEKLEQPDNEKPGSYQYKPKFAPEGFATKWHECPWDSEAEAESWCNALNGMQWEIISVPINFSKGKERDLDGARRAACWPEATDEQLCLPKAELTEILEARKVDLLAEFKAAMLEIGFVYPEGK